MMPSSSLKLTVLPFVGGMSIRLGLTMGEVIVFLLVPMIFPLPTVGEIGMYILLFVLRLLLLFFRFTAVVAAELFAIGLLALVRVGDTLRVGLTVEVMNEVGFVKEVKLVL